MDLVATLASIALIATLSTLVLGVLACLAFRAREKRRPLESPAPARKVFLVRLGLPDAPRPSIVPRSRSVGYGSCVSSSLVDPR
jgi:hypothetical protein